MNKFIYYVRKLVFPNLAIAIFVTGLVASTSVAAYKLSQSVPTITQASSTEKDSTESLSDLDDSSFDDDDNDIINHHDDDFVVASSKITQSDSTSSKAVASQSVVKTSLNTPPVAAVSGAFTSATLASHNKAGDCFVAYSGKVYDVSNSSAWSGCSHHGARGGIDITSSFPHSTNYFNSLPVVGDYSGGATVGNNPIIRGDDDDDEYDDEDEYEDYENEDEYEDD